MKSGRKMRSHVKWTLMAVLCVTVIFVFFLSKYHSGSEKISAKLNVREFSFTAGSDQIFDPADHEQFVISGISRLKIRRHIGSPRKSVTETIERQGNNLTTCTFSNVHTTPLTLTGETRLRLIWTDEQLPGIAVRAHGPVEVTVTPATRPLAGSSYFCTGLDTKSNTESGIQDVLSDQVVFHSTTDSQIDFRGFDEKGLKQTNVAVFGDLDFSHIEIKKPGDPPSPKPVFQKSDNEITFTDANKTVKIGDPLLIIRPKSGFVIETLSVDDGIQLNLAGTVSGVFIGTGSAAQNLMPTLFDRLEAWRVLAVIPAIVAFILGIWEKFGGLPKR